MEVPSDCSRACRRDRRSRAGRQTRRFEQEIFDPPACRIVWAAKNPADFGNEDGIAVGNHAHNAGRVLVSMIGKRLEGNNHIETAKGDDQRLDITIAQPAEVLSEEDRSRQPSVLSVLCAIVAHFYLESDDDLALFGAFGYDIAYRVPVQPGG